MPLCADIGAATSQALDLLALHRLHPQRYPFLLESASRHPQTARYDLLFAFPGQSLELRNGVVSNERGEAIARNFFEALGEALRAEAGHGPLRDDPIPFAGGWYVYLGYEAVGEIEPRLRLPPSSFHLPDALAVRCPGAVVVDRIARRGWLIAEEPAQLAQMQADLGEAARLPAPAALPAVEIEEEDPARHRQSVERILEYLRAGDAFQVNLSRAWRARFASAPEVASLYQALRSANPAPFAGLMHWNGGHVLSSSPERLLAFDGRQIETRPIAGTCARLVDADEDAAARGRLVASAKERAEHVMLIDLERNDLGRVCEAGSIAVSDLMEIESYAHVHHLVSSVRGRVREGLGPAELLRALFPGGTITGCPKVRVMQIIAELEQEGRGPYTGAMGYVSRDGHSDFNILIRSMALEGTLATLRAGGGIVADSRPDTELAETRHKARGLLRALGAAV